MISKRNVFPFFLGVISLCVPALAQENTLVEAESAYSVGDYETAEPLYVQAVEAYGDVHDQAYTRALDRLANCYYMEGKLSRSIEIFRAVVKLDEKWHGANSLKVADDLYELTRALRRLSRFDEAEPVMRRTLQLRKQVLGEDHRLVAISWLDLAVNYQRQGRLQDAESAFLSSIAIRDRLDDPAFAATAYMLYSKLLQMEDRVPEAEKVSSRSDELKAKSYTKVPNTD